jgi:hypothetical protein
MGVLTTQCFLYSLYDVNHDGYITRAEMLAVTSAIYDLLGDSSNAAQHCPQSHVNMIFKVHRLSFSVLHIINLSMLQLSLIL